MTADSVLEDNGVESTLGWLDMWDRIVLQFTRPMDRETIGSSFQIGFTTVEGSNVFTVKPSESDDNAFLVRITATDQQYFDDGEGSFTVFSEWDEGNTRLVIYMSEFEMYENLRLSDVSQNTSEFTLGLAAVSAAGETNQGYTVTGNVGGF